MAPPTVKWVLSNTISCSIPWLTIDRLPGPRQLFASVFDNFRPQDSRVARSVETEASGCLSALLAHRPMEPLTVPHATGTDFVASHTSYGVSGVTYSRHPSESTASSGYTGSKASSLAEFSTSPTETSPSGTDETGQNRRRSRRQRPRRKRTSDENKPKNQKEKNHRRELQRASHDRFDMVQNFCGPVSGNNLTKQSAGNEKASGLTINKLDADHIHFAVLGGIATDAYKDALLNGRGEEFLVSCRRRMQDFLNGTPRDPTVGTFMYDPSGRPCVRGENEICATHGELNPIACRDVRRQEIWRTNLDLFRQEHGLANDKRRMA